ncbi:MAG: glycosyltransferase family 4 protein [Paracoccaceae bacterium]
MAVGADAVAVDGTEVNAPADRNAAIWYAADGYEPAKKGINGRRVAGDSFLRGFFRHAEVDEFVALTAAESDNQALGVLRQELRPHRRLRCVWRYRPAGMAPVGTMFYSGPNFVQELWRRAPLGSSAYSICGMTHTTATLQVMQGLYDLRMGPSAEWDAVICTSRAVRASVLAQMEMIDSYAVSRFGKAPPMLQLPVIPLGVHCDDFAPDPAKRESLRARLGLGPQDVLCTIIARLNPDVKFDPLPLYLAMQAARSQLPKRQKLHLCVCGIFLDMPGGDQFDEGAARLMPDVGYTRLDGAVAGERQAALSAADMFLFPIDNIQETFGLAPVEAMAAGLPLVVSDWDGMKDTVSEDVGFRVPTRTLTGAHTVSDGYRYATGLDGYQQFSARLSAMTQIDVPVLTKRIVELAKDPALRRRMGEAGKARARTMYDWAAVIPQMQDLWAELAARRRAGRGQVCFAGALPIFPSPLSVFKDYPTEQRGFGDERYGPTDQTGRASPADVYELRRYAAHQRPFQSAAHVASVWQTIQSGGAAGLSAHQVAAQAGLPLLAVERVMMWLLKLDFIRDTAR